MWSRKEYLCFKTGGMFLWSPGLSEEDKESIVHDVQNQPRTDRGELDWIPFWQRIQRPKKMFDTRVLPDGSTHLLKVVPYW